MSSMSMTQLIESEKKDVKLNEVKDLVLDGCSATEIEGLTDEYTSLESLSIVGAGLTTLAGLPALPALTKLNVAENPITEGIDAVAKCTKLTSINLSGNKLSRISDLVPLASLECLCSLELNNCEIAGIENYRKDVFAILPQLKYLDGLDANGEEESSVAAVHAGTNGTANGHTEEAQCDDEEEDDEEEDEEDDEEEIGISALQGSKDLDDDEEDYVPGEEDDAADDDDDGEDDEEEEGDADEADVIANLSGAGVTGSRRAAKRPADDDAFEVTDAKHSAPDASGDAEEESNGV